MLLNAMPWQQGEREDVEGKETWDTERKFDSHTPGWYHTSGFHWTGESGFVQPTPREPFFNTFQLLGSIIYI